MSENLLFLIIIAIGVITYATRSSFIMIAGSTDKFPYFQKALRFVPVTVLPALIMPALFCHNGIPDISIGNERLVAGILAIVIAMYKKNVLLTLCAGMGSLWILQAI
ncbi:AzlD domain-containing protein [Desulfococcaceae bacterium HSG8]|nr:AzlD domain-containing protein [Desulfococcaceae bacterium HSG8]